MSGINQNSFNGEGRLKISSSTSTYLTLGYTGSSQLDFDLPQSYGSSGQGLITDGTGGLSWGAVSGASGTNGTSGSSGSSGVSGSSGSSGSSGTNGTSGSSGSSGVSGSSGQSGTSGSSGSSGQSGSSGSSGSSGTSPSPIGQITWNNSTNSYQTLSIPNVGTSGKMIGATGGFYFTPKSTGVVYVNYEFQATQGVSDMIYELRYGTGVAPIDGAAATGTSVSERMISFGNQTNLSFIVNGLTIGTQYWFAVLAKAVSLSGTLIYEYINASAFELGGVVGATGNSGTSGTSGTSFAPAYFSGWSQKTQTKAAGAETFVHFTDNIETQWGFNAFTSATQSWISVVSDGYYQFHYMVSLGHQNNLDNQAVFFLKKNGVTWSGTGIAFAAKSSSTYGSGTTIPYYEITGSWQAQLNALDKIEIFLYSASDLVIRGGQSIPSGKLMAYKLETI